MCVEHMGVNIWNSIEIETRNCKDLKLFKVKYKEKSFNTDVIFIFVVFVCCNMVHISVYGH